MATTTVNPRIAREVSPPSHRLWLRQSEDEATKLAKELADWLKTVSGNESLFKENVYENKDLAEFDLRQHRARLCGLIGRGEFLAIEYINFGIRTGKTKDVQAQVGLIDQTVKELLTTVFEWHAPLDAQTDVPDSFKESVKEVDAGKIEDLDV